MGSLSMEISTLLLLITTSLIVLNWRFIASNEFGLLFQWHRCSNTWATAPAAPTAGSFSPIRSRPSIWPMQIDKCGPMWTNWWCHFGHFNHSVCINWHQQCQKDSSYCELKNWMQTQNEFQSSHHFFFSISLNYTFVWLAFAISSLCEITWISEKR